MSSPSCPSSRRKPLEDPDAAHPLAQMARPNVLSRHSQHPRWPRQPTRTRTRTILSPPTALTSTPTLLPATLTTSAGLPLDQPQTHEHTAPRSLHRSSATCMWCGRAAPLARWHISSSPRGCHPIPLRRSPRPRLRQVKQCIVHCVHFFDGTIGMYDCTHCFMSQHCRCLMSGAEVDQFFVAKDLLLGDANSCVSTRQ